LGKVGDSCGIVGKLPCSCYSSVILRFLCYCLDMEDVCENLHSFLDHQAHW